MIIFRNKLTKEEIKKYIKKENQQTGVAGISEEDLKKIRLLKIKEVKKDIIQGTPVLIRDNKIIAVYDDFTPKARSIYHKPSYAGRQVIMGRIGRELIFSNGRWFEGRGWLPPLQKKEIK